LTNSENVRIVILKENEHSSVNMFEDCVEADLALCCAAIQTCRNE